MKGEGENERESKVLIREASFYTLIDGELYRRGLSMSFLKCIAGGQLEPIMAGIHDGVCASHIGGRSLAVKILRDGFYWPTMRKDCLEYVKKCHECQMFADMHKAPPHFPATISSPWPFSMWSTDLLGPFPAAKSQIKYVIVAVDYFTKWIGAEAISDITFERVKNSYWKE